SRRCCFRSGRRAEAPRHAPTQAAASTLHACFGMARKAYVRWLEEVRNGDVASVGGKNASLGELIEHLSAVGVRVPGGFATTAEAYRAFLSHNDLERTLRDLTGALE